jgi:hypothetical protein
MNHPFRVSAALLLLTAGCAHAATLNLTSVVVDTVPVSNYTGHNNQTYVGGDINGVLFQRSVPGSGSGQFRMLFRMEDDNDPGVTEAGYNRGGIMDSKTPNGFDPLVRLQDLVQNTEGGFYMFALDANENNGGNNRYISLDMFKIYVGGLNDPSPLPANQANLGQLGTQVYTFSTNDRVLLDANTGSGSGTADMYVFVPTSLFSGFAPDSYVYVYAEHGGYTGTSPGGFGASSGFEEWATLKVPVPTFIPEPCSAGLAVVACFLAAAHRRRSAQRGH